MQELMPGSHIFKADMANHCQIKLKIKCCVVVFHWAIPQTCFVFCISSLIIYQINMISVEIPRKKYIHI